MDEFFLWVADKFLAPCTSAAYSGYNVSDLSAISNEMAKILDHAGRAQKFAFLSYLSTWEPPKHEKQRAIVLEWARYRNHSRTRSLTKKSDVNTRCARISRTQLQMFGPQNTQVLATGWTITYSGARTTANCHTTEGAQSDLDISGVSYSRRDGSAS